MQQGWHTTSGTLQKQLPNLTGQSSCLEQAYGCSPYTKGITFSSTLLFVIFRSFDTSTMFFTGNLGVSPRERGTSNCTSWRAGTVSNSTSNELYFGDRLYHLHTLCFTLSTSFFSCCFASRSSCILPCLMLCTLRIVCVLGFEECHVHVCICRCSFK